MTVKSCPPPQTLESLLSGRLTGPDSEQLEEHLLGCDQCLAIARTIPASDDLTAAIHARRDLDGDEDVLAEAVERAKQLRSQAETLETDETLSAKLTPQAEEAANASKVRLSLDEEIDFLAPAEEADEIGRLGGYRILGVLGVGGMGVVFRAEDPKLKRQIALKALKPAVAASKSAKDRFVREAQATAAIEHDNIVHIYQVGEDRNIPFIAMQFLRGESLRKRLDREKQLDQREVLRIGREVATGLEAAHKRGLVHRDIKPDNIWIEEDTGRAKILDFGLVRTSTDDAGLTQSGMVLGTPRYMAPEQAKGETVDQRCDLFSLGSVLYHLATGRAPFEGGNLTATLIAVAQKDPDPVEQVCPWIEPGLSQLTMRLLSKNPDQRPRSATEVSKSLAGIEQKLIAKEAEKARQRQIAETTVLDQSPAAKSEPKPQLESHRSIFYGGAVVTLALALFAWLYYAGFIVKFESEHGTLIVNVTGNDFATSIKGQKVTIKNTETGRTITINLNSPEVSESLEPGTYFMLETDSGLTTLVDHFTIRSGEDKVVEVTWKPRQRVAEAETGGSERGSDASSEGVERSTRPVTSGDRAAAEYVQSISGHPYTHIVIRQNGEERRISNSELESKPLPEGPFELTGVHLQHNREVTDEGLANLKDCQHLTLLHLGYTSISDAGLAHLAACSKNLRELYLPSASTDAGLAIFKDCRELTRLSLQSARASAKGLENFKHCKKLTFLFLGGIRLEGVSLDSFAGCTELESLDARNTGLNPAELAHFKDCKKLKHLDISGNPAIGNKELGYFRECTDLTNLNIAYADVDDNGLSFLADCKNLGYLNVAKTSVSEGFLQSLSNKLPDCKVERKPKWPSPARSLEPDGR